ncbi:MAG: hypothetical protein AAB674_03455 [Patescibacteria group bacterium]
MRLIIKIPISVSLLVAVFLFFSVGTLFPIVVQGATAEELQAQISALLAQIQALQAQLTEVSASNVSRSVPAELLSSGNLTIGSKGGAVIALQNYLGMSTVTGYFGNLTKASLAKWQAANGVSPAAGYFGTITRAKLAAISSEVISTPSTPTTPAVTIPVIPESVIEATLVPAVVPALPNPFESTLKIEGTFQSRTYSTYGNKILNEFKLIADEKIGITRIKFKNTGTLADSNLANIQLINSKTDKVVATVDTPVNKVIEFKMAYDASKSDNGLVVSGETYYIYAFILTPNIGELKPKIQLDIESVFDISAFDYNDLTRVAVITKNNSFPITGPTLTIW